MSLLIPSNVFSKPVIEYRSMPTLIEQRNNLITEMETLIKLAKTEVRAMNDDEQAKFNQVKEDIQKIDNTIQAQQQADQLLKTEMQETKTPEQEEQRSLQEDAFLRFIRGEERALDVAGNGGIIPTLISDRIIQKVYELSPILQRATVFNIGGDLVFPSFDYNGITTAYVADMTALTPQNSNFTTIKLQNFIAGALVTISRSLMNRSDFDLVTFIVNQMAMSIAKFIEQQLLVGVGTTAATGVFVDANSTLVTAGSATALALDDLVNVQLSVPEEYQNNSAWLMNKSVFSTLRKIKDTTGMPLLLQNSSSVEGGYGWELLGRPVMISQNAPNTLTTGLKALAYGDFSGLYCKLAQNVEIQVLNELYSIQHAVGVVGYVELDSRVVEPQKIAVLRMA